MPKVGMEPLRRKALIDAGLMAGGKPGVWELTDAGRSTAY